MPASSTQRVWMKSAVVERELGNAPEERRLLKAALERFPYFDKLWLMLGQLEQRQGAVAAARLAFQNGLKRCISSVPLWRVRPTAMCLFVSLLCRASVLCRLACARGLKAFVITSCIHRFCTNSACKMLLLSKLRVHAGGSAG